MITVWELDDRYERTGCKLAETIKEGVIVVRQKGEEMCLERNPAHCEDNDTSAGMGQGSVVGERGLSARNSMNLGDSAQAYPRFVKLMLGEEGVNNMG